MKRYTRVLTIAGSDSGGGAGIQADIKTISACGCYAASAITAITAQNTVGVRDVYPLNTGLVISQIEAVLDDIGVDAVKIGMLGSAEITIAVADTLKRYGVENIVLDPVLVATSGDTLTASGAVEAILTHLMPIARIVTPNLIEASVLSGVSISSEADYDAVWQVLSQRGANALLLKAGHSSGDMLFDTLFEATTGSKAVFATERIHTANTHGTGCTLSSAIASFLALGFELEDAVREAICYVHKAIGAACEYKLGEGHGPVHHFHKFWE